MQPWFSPKRGRRRMRHQQPRRCLGPSAAGIREHGGLGREGKEDPGPGGIWNLVESFTNRLIRFGEAAEGRGRTNCSQHWGKGRKNKKQEPRSEACWMNWERSENPGGPSTRQQSEEAGVGCRHISLDQTATFHEVKSHSKAQNRETWNLTGVPKESHRLPGN